MPTEVKKLRVNVKTAGKCRFNGVCYGKGVAEIPGMEKLPPLWKGHAEIVSDGAVNKSKGGQV